MPFSTAQKLTANSAQVAFDVTGIKWTFRPNTPVLIHRLLATVSIVLTGPAVIFTVDHAIAGLVGAGVDPVPTGIDALGTFTVPALTVVADGAFKDAEDFTAGAPLLVLVGEQIEFNIAGGGATTGDGFLAVEYQPLPFVDVNFARSRAGWTTPLDTTTLGTMTQVTS